MTPKNKTNREDSFNPSLFYFVLAFQILIFVWIGPDIDQVVRFILGLMF